MAAIKRPVGVTIISGIMTIVGGSLTLFTIIEVLETLYRMGVHGIAIISPVALIGFFIYGIIPVLFYSVGLSLFFARQWAYRFMVVFFPKLALILVFLILIETTRKALFLRHFDVFSILLRRPAIFLWVIFLYIVLIWPIKLYFTSPYIKSYFLSQFDD